MKANINGKKLLILGATANEIVLVGRAQELGVYVIVTDYNLDHRLSPAKDVANEYWDISWSDIDALEKRCLEAGVDGITAGYSEIRIDHMIQLCQRLNLPSYATPEQLEVTRNKVTFKETCKKYGVPLIPQYDSAEQITELPVIVKPADRAGSIGVGIAFREEEISRVCETAMEKSLRKQIIIEKYMMNAVEMDVHYAIVDGNITLLCTDDIIPAKANLEAGKVVQSAWVYPSKYEDAFLEKVDAPLRRMIHGMGIQNGTIFFSGFATEKEEFYFFECGFRLWGEQEFEYNYRRGLMNYLDIYIYHALTGSAAGAERNLQGNPRLKGVALNFYAASGEIHTVCGLDRIVAMEDCTLAVLDAYCGQKCDESAAILSKIALIGFANEYPVHLQEDVERAYRMFSVTGTQGEDMVYDRIETRQIASWWEKENIG